MPYNPSFIIGYAIPLPSVSEDLAAPLLKGSGSVIDYHHHSVVMNRERKFAFFSASNIDGNSWQPISRVGSFNKDERIDHSFQFGEELYSAISKTPGKKNDFDEGHLTSFQEVLWGEPDDMQKAGDDTFYFTNCVPQHALLNRGVWKSLEQYILKKGADQNDVRLSVFTGPVFLPGDPYFTEKIGGQLIRIPCTFWKIIYYKTTRGLQAVGFMMSHKDLLLDEGTVTFDKDQVTEKELIQDDVFMLFPEAGTYQVQVEQIEKITRLPFHLKGVHLPFTAGGSRQITFKKIEVVRTKGMDEPGFNNELLDFKLEGIKL
jgi:endonuclease G